MLKLGARWFPMTGFGGYPSVSCSGSSNINSSFSQVIISYHSNSPLDKHWILSFFQDNILVNMVGIIFAAVMALPMLALGTPATNYGNNPRLPRCSPRDVPCSCPRGTTFKNITTYAVLGAPATDLRAVMFDCETISAFL